MYWFIDWEYAATVTGAGPFVSLVKALDYIAKDVALMSQSGYGEQLERIWIQDGTLNLEGVAHDSSATHRRV